MNYGNYGSSNVKFN